jgi:hypothetical protein
MARAQAQSGDEGSGARTRDARGGRTAPPVALVALAAAAGFVAAQAFWLCVPVAVAGAALSGARGAAALLAAFAVLAAPRPARPGPK